MARKRGAMKNVYVVKSAPPDVEASHKEFEGKNVYLLKEDQQAVNRYSDIVLDYIDKDGLFLIVGHDKLFFQNFRNSFYKELDVDVERIRLVANQRRALSEIRVYLEYKKTPFLFVESILEGRSALSFVEELRSEFKSLMIIVLMQDVDERLVAQFVEAGADNFITKPVSTNILIEKIASTIEPPDLIGKMVREGKERLKNVEFALAYGVARDILKEKPGSPAGLMIMGDALKGLSKREDALKMYLKAAENAPMYLEPLKKILDFYKDEGDQEGALRYLLKIDELSPLHINRKIEIGDLMFMQGDATKAAGYYADAVSLAHSQRLPESPRMAEDFAEKIFEVNPTASCSLLELCSKLAKAYRVEMPCTIYNKLGMILRRLKRWKEAVEAYTKASTIAPNDETILFNMGMAYIEGQDFGSAAQKFERAMTVKPNFYSGNLAAAYLMGQVFIKANRPRNAFKVLDYVQSQDPNYKKVQGLLDSLKPKKKK